MIMNEKERVKSLLELGDFSTNDYHEVRLIIRYFITELDMKIKEEIIEKLESLLEDKMTDYYEWDWEERIEATVTEELKNKTPITSIDSVYITNREWEIVKSLKNKFHRKLLFTLIIYARYNAIKKQIETNWTSVSNQQDIFRSANINDLTLKRQNLVVKDLIDMGLISQSKHMRKLNLKVDCMNEGGGEFMRVDSFSDLGNIIEEKMKPILEEEKRIKELEEKEKALAKKLEKGYKICEVCGKAYKPKNNRNKYCSPCARRVNIEKTKENKKKLKKV